MTITKQLNEAKQNYVNLLEIHNRNVNVVNGYLLRDLKQTLLQAEKAYNEYNLKKIRYELN